MQMDPYACSVITIMDLAFVQPWGQVHNLSLLHCRALRDFCWHSKSFDSGALCTFNNTSGLPMETISTVKDAVEGSEGFSECSTRLYMTLEQLKGG